MAGWMREYPYFVLTYAGVAVDSQAQERQAGTLYGANERVMLHAESHLSTSLSPVDIDM